MKLCTGFLTSSVTSPVTDRAAAGDTPVACGGARLISLTAAGAGSTHLLIDRSRVRLKLGRVTTRDVGPLAVSGGLSSGGAAVSSANASFLTWTVASSTCFLWCSSLTVLAASTWPSAVAISWSLSAAAAHKHTHTALLQHSSNLLDYNNSTRGKKLLNGYVRATSTIRVKNFAFQWIPTP